MITVTHRRSAELLAVFAWAGLLCCLASLRAAAEPFFVDQSPVLNASMEDDGVANNGAGGWTDEGIT